MFVRSHSLGISPVSRDCWNKCADTWPSSFASSFRTLGWSSSGPKAFEGFKPVSNLHVITPSVDTRILSMKGDDLLVNGTSLYSVLLNTSLNWPISSSALSVQSLVLQLHFLPTPLFKGWNTLPVFFFDYLCICRSLWDLPLHHLPSYSHTNHAAF